MCRLTIITMAVVAGLVLTSATSIAERDTGKVQAFTEEYAYQASEHDSKVTSRTFALQQVKRLLLEKIGTYLESETEIRNFQLTKDQIVTLAAGIVSTEIIEERWDGKTYYLKARITANPEDVINSIKKLRQDRAGLTFLSINSVRGKREFGTTRELGPMKIGPMKIGAKWVEAKWGCRDLRTLATVIPPWFDHVNCLGVKGANDLTPVAVGSKWGYVDGYGRMVVKPQFDFADHFSEGRAAVNFGGTLSENTQEWWFPWDIKGGKWGYIDRTGKMVSELQIVVTWDSGKTESQPIFDFAYEFSEYRAAVAVRGKWGYVDTSGKIVIPLQFDEAESFQEGLASVRIGDKWGYVDTSGKIVIPPQFDDEPAGFSEGLASVRIGDKWGYVDTSGKIVIPPQFDHAVPFQEGLASVRIGNKCGFINNKGSIVIAAQFDMIGLLGFSEGLMAVKVGEKWGFINKAGEVVIKTQFRHANDAFHQGEALVFNNDGTATYIDRTGASNENWEYFFKGGYDTFYYLNTKQVTYPSKNVSRAWIKGLSEEYGTSLSLWETDCLAKKVRSISQSHYDAYGKVVASDSSARDWEHAVPGSLGETFHDLLCHQKSALWRGRWEGEAPPSEKKRPTKE